MDDDLQFAAIAIENNEPHLYTGEDSMEALAHHEAGHAILNRLTHRPFQVIAMDHYAGYVGGGDEDVVTHFRRVKSEDEALLKARILPEMQDRLRKQLAARDICVYLAGLQAELLLNGEQFESEVVRDDFDHRNARQLVEDAFGASTLLYFQARTRDYLSRCWAEVERTANELLARYDRYGLAVIRLSNPSDASFFEQDTLPARWTDEYWD